MNKTRKKKYENIIPWIKRAVLDYQGKNIEEHYKKKRLFHPIYLNNLLLRGEGGGEASTPHHPSSVRIYTDKSFKKLCLPKLPGYINPKYIFVNYKQQCLQTDFLKMSRGVSWADR